MNVAFVLRTLGGPGGTEKVAWDLASALVSAGVSLHVYCVSAVDPPAGVRVQTLRVPGRGWSAERALLRASLEIPRGSHDVVQGFGLTLGHDVYRAGGGVHARWLAALSASGGWGHVASRLPREWWAARVDRQAARSARMVVCNSERVAGEVVATHGVRPDRVRVVRNGVDGQRFTPDPARREEARERWAVPKGGRVALFLGSGFRRKGLDVAARAFERVATPDDRFVVIGRDSRASARLRRVADRLGSALVAWGPVADPERWIPGADAVLLPTLYDASANSTLEALSCGVPAVTSSMDGAGEVVPERAWIVEDPADVGGFAAALFHAWSGGPGLALRCRGAAAEWTVARSATSMIELYEELSRVVAHG